MAKSQYLINPITSTKSAIDIQQYAQQGGTSPIVFVIHNYTDGHIMQLDNVGSSNRILTLVNAHNPIRRPDKDADYVGWGDFITLQEYDVALSINARLFRIDPNARLVWDGKKGMTWLDNGKADDGTAGYQIRTVQVHDKLLQIANASKPVIIFRNTLPVSGVPTRAVIQADITQTNGMLLDGNEGPLYLEGQSNVINTKSMVTTVTEYRNSNRSLFLIKNDVPISGVNSRTVLESPNTQANGMYIHAVSGGIILEGTTDINVKNPIRFTPGEASAAGVNSLFLDVSDGKIKFKNASGTVVSWY